MSPSHPSVLLCASTWAGPPVSCGTRQNVPAMRKEYSSSRRRSSSRASSCGVPSSFNTSKFPHVEDQVGDRYAPSDPLRVGGVGQADRCGSRPKSVPPVASIATISRPTRPAAVQQAGEFGHFSG